MGRGGAVTIRDVAAAAGVHPATASRAFSAPHLLRPATRDAVLAAAARLGYRPNQTARALTTGRTSHLAVIVPDIANPFFPPLIKAAQRSAREHGYQVFVADTDEDPATEEEVVTALARRVDGLLLVSPRLPGDAVARLAAGPPPLVLVNRSVPGLPAVLMDVGGGTEAAVAHLADLGHRRIVLLGGPRGSWTGGEMRRHAAGAAARLGVDLAVRGPNAPTREGAVWPPPRRWPRARRPWWRTTT